GSGCELAAGHGHIAEIDERGRDVQLIVAGLEALAGLLEKAGGGSELALVLFQDGHVVEHGTGFFVLVEAVEQGEGALIEVEGGVPIAGGAAAVGLNAQRVGGLDAVAGGEEDFVGLLAAGGGHLRGVAVDIAEALLEAEMSVEKLLGWRK